MHNDQIPRRVPIQYTPGFSINNQPMGYNRVGYQKRLRQARNSHLDLYNQESIQAYSPRRVDMQNINYWSNQSERARFRWSPMPELVRLPITGTPDKYSVQYVMYDVKPISDNSAVARTPKKRSFAQTVRRVFMTHPKEFTS